MAKLRSWDELKSLREKIESRKNENKTIIAVGMGTCGIAAGSREALNAFSDELSASSDNVSLITTGCMGYCFAEPVVEVRVPGKPPVFYGHVDSSLAREIYKSHITGGHPVESARIEI